MDINSIARALGGDVSGRSARVPGPGHSPKDRSLSITPADNDDGFICHSFAGDDPIYCKDYIKEKLGLPAFKPNRHTKTDRPEVDISFSQEGINWLAQFQKRATEQQHNHNRKVVVSYDYKDSGGNLLYQNCRLEPKDFRQRRPDGKGGWDWSLRGLQGRRVLYRLPDLLSLPDATVFVTEGEKDADNVIGLGYCATTVASHKWTDECVKALAGRDCWILEDNDDPGLKHAVAAASALYGTAKSIRIVSLPGLGPRLPRNGKDVSDWLELGHTAAELEEVCSKTPEWKPGAEQSTSKPTATKTECSLTSVRSSKVPVRAIIWMWPGRFAVGKLGLLAGLPDEGKGQVLCDMAARVTHGRSWPCDEGNAPKGNVILLTAEDDLSDTVVPRLIAAGADLDRVEIITMVCNANGERMFNLIDDLELLRQKITKVGDVVMVQIDPLSAYFGVKKADSFRTTDVRAVLGPLVQLAADMKVAIIGVLHFNKKLDVTNALLRISDSLAFGAAARHVYAIVDDAENGRKLMVKGKNNLAPSKQKALAYQFATKDVATDPNTGVVITAPHIIWHHDYVDVTASEAMQAATENRSPSVRDEAKEFLYRF
jgi:hypothetical protein